MEALAADAPPSAVRRAGRHHRTRRAQERRINGFFDKRARISPGEFFLRFEVDSRALQYPLHAVRRTGHSSVDYPVIHAAGVSAEGRLRLAVSVLCAFPFRSEQVADALSGGDVEKALSMLPGSVTEDIRLSREYRTFPAKKAFNEILKQLEAYL